MSPSITPGPDGGLYRPGPHELHTTTAALVVETVSPNDDTWEKLAFYGADRPQFASRAFARRADDETGLARLSARPAQGQSDAKRRQPLPRATA